MQTPTRMNKVVIEDYYHIIIMDENVNWMEPAHMFTIFSLYPRAPLGTLPSGRLEGIV